MVVGERRLEGDWGLEVEGAVEADGVVACLSGLLPSSWYLRQESKDSEDYRISPERIP